MSEVTGQSAPSTGGADKVQRRFSTRDKTTKKSVIIKDRAADLIIRVGGIGVILAIAAIVIFLVSVVVPMFTGNQMEREVTHDFGLSGKRTLASVVDEYRTVALFVTEDGSISARHIATGRSLKVDGFDFGDVAVTAVGRTVNGRNMTFGFEDGTVRFAELTVKVEVLVARNMPDGLERLEGGDLTDGSAIYMPLPDEQFRKLSVETTLSDPQKVSDAGVAITHVDYYRGGTPERPTRTFATLDFAGVARVSRAEDAVNIMTREVRTRLTSTMIPLPDRAGRAIVNVLTNSRGDEIYVALEDGTFWRFDLRTADNPVLAETSRLTDEGVRLTSMDFIIGEQSLVVGGADGSVNIYFRLQRADADTTDRYRMVRAREMEPQEAAIIAFSPSQRNKMFATADASGQIWVRYSTSNRVIFRLSKEGATKFSTVSMAPRNDGLLVVDERGRGTFWYYRVPHPETTLQTMFGKVWYEGYSEPSYTWQSSSGTDVFESKMSLTPLIFGTIKATFYALLFALPIALLAAIFTSEFCHPAVRNSVKPTMEMMASLPSVVLGFIAALVLAPIVETWIAAVLTAFIGLPLTLLLSAYLWQLLPLTLRSRLDGLPKFALMFVMVAIGVYASISLGTVFERLLFYGDFKAWLDGRVGSGTPFTFLVLIPLSYLIVWFAARRTVGPWLTRTSRELEGSQVGLMDLVRWLAFLLAAGLLAYVLAMLLHAIGYDPRGGVVDTYAQRNTLVVGFAMGFAVIPIIYTIAEDALNSVPEHLRAASLACGATKWQTTMSVILPTAISGVFAAVMIGMGRAVGETMIVVMAAGNTPVMEWNIFSGLRALSANIAVELPEAVKDSSLYRMLFMAALTLFVMTFVINTVAEIVRLRYRKRSVQL